ncbi:MULTISPECIES: acyl carrier protein [Lachnospira]|jgi:acyl carrier protein|uniref:Acyl carrier protein n=1 Tax=Lachnospira multipara TaxID=28051 RepID=A0A1H5UCS0_9FIRM|nr:MULTISPECIES: phosphopantetheine-binding protein [Lachnospira]SEF72883.1 acyl carrier protein [Lachnospira multipara]
MEQVREFILDRLQKEYSFKEGTDIEKINYVEEGYMDSLGLIQFIGELEDEFDIEFSDEEMMEDSFRVVGSLIDLVTKKVGE